jgi:hypothetical protein
MTDRDKAESGHEPRLKKLRCRRTNELVTPEQHAECPYCQGKVADVETGHYEAFCDYDEGQDPIHFGFPEDSSRQQHG